MAEKVMVMVLVLKVDLACSCCYKKVKKVLCKFPQIRDQECDLKQNTVTITIVCCNPEKMRDKLCCKGRKVIKSIEIKEPQKPKKTDKPKDEAKQVEKPTPDPTPAASPTTAPPTTAYPAGRVCCGPCCEGYGGGPCYHGYGMPPPQYPCYDGYGYGYGYGDGYGYGYGYRHVYGYDYAGNKS